MKKLILVLFALFLVGCSAQSAYDVEELSDDVEIDQFSQSSAAYPWPSSLEEIEEKSDLIIKAKMNGMIEVGNYDNNYDINARITSTLSEIEVTEVFKGDLSVGDRTVVTELFYLMGGQVTTIEHYVPMEQDEEYLLFLTNWDDESWAINYMGFGKYHFEKESANQSIQNYKTMKEVRNFQFMSEYEEEVALFDTLFEEVKDKYHSDENK